jgi:LAS superfamily LD-carboxypeptidase LdcB
MRNPDERTYMEAFRFDALELTGRARTHVQQYAQPRFAARPEAASAFLALRAAARSDGIDLLPIASYRPFDRQLHIWNRKFSGEAVLHDQAGLPIDAASLSPQDNDHVLDVDAFQTWDQWHVCRVHGNVGSR